MININKKIAMSAFSIVTALTMLGGSAFAAFQVSATSNGSTFSSGNPSLQLCDDSSGPINCGTQIGNPINVTDLIPGTPKTFTFWIANTGTDTLAPLSTIFSGQNGTGAGSTNKLEKDLQVSIACDGTSGSAAAGPASFNVWESNINLGGAIAPSTNSKCIMTVELPSGNTTDANQSLSFNATFGGTDGL